MKYSTRTAACLLALTTLTNASGQAQANGDVDFQSGLKAYQEQNYSTAFEIWKRCADNSLAACEYGLGVLYDEGLAVPPDIYTALRWYERAALQGYPDAMLQLGFLYASGRDEIIQNAVLAWVWFARAASLNVERAQEYRDRVGQYLTGSELADAQRRLDLLSIELHLQ